MDAVPDGVETAGSQEIAFAAESAEFKARLISEAQGYPVEGGEVY